MKIRYKIKRMVSVFLIMIMMTAVFGVMGSGTEEVNASGYPDGNYDHGGCYMSAEEKPNPNFWTGGHLFNYYFRPTAGLTRAELAQIIVNMHRDTNYNEKAFKLHPISNEKGYRCSDINRNPNAWYTEAVRFCLSIGVMNGYSDGTFRPNKVVTRAEYIKTIMEYRKTKLFAAPTKKLWSSNYYYTAVKGGWLPGSVSKNNYWNSTYYSNANMSRGEAAYILCQALGRGTCADKRTQLWNMTDVTKNTPYWREIMEVCASAHFANRPEYGIVK